MKIKETLQFFLNLRSNSIEKSKIKVYDKYIGILYDLTNRDLTHNQIQSIESKLETLNLNVESDHNKKYLIDKLSEFQKFLKERLTLVSEGYYAEIGAGTGIIIGSIFSVLFQSELGAYTFLIGINGGIILGAILGRMKDSKAKKQGNVLITKVDKNTSHEYK